MGKTINPITWSYRCRKCGNLMSQTEVADFAVVGHESDTSGSHQPMPYCSTCGEDEFWEAVWRYGYALPTIAPKVAKDDPRTQSGAMGMRYGDRIVYEIDGRHGKAGEFMYDGDVDIAFDDGTFDVVKWNYCHKEAPEKASAEVYRERARRLIRSTLTIQDDLAADMTVEAFVAEIHDSEVGHREVLRLEAFFRDVLSSVRSEERARAEGKIEALRTQLIWTDEQFNMALARAGKAEGEIARLKQENASWCTKYLAAKVRVDVAEAALVTAREVIEDIAPRSIAARDWLAAHLTQKDNFDA